MTSIADKELVKQITDEVDVLISEKDDSFCYMITKGKYKGIAFLYADIKVGDEENEDGSIPLEFQVIPLSNQNDVPMVKEEFDEYCGNILVKLIEKIVEDMATQAGY